MNDETIGTELDNLIKQHNDMMTQASMLCHMAELLIGLDRNNSINFAVEKCAKLANIKDRNVINKAVSLLVAKWTDEQPDSQEDKELSALDTGNAKKYLETNYPGVKFKTY